MEKFLLFFTTKTQSFFFGGLQTPLKLENDCSNKLKYTKHMYFQVILTQRASSRLQNQKPMTQHHICKCLLYFPRLSCFPFEPAPLSSAVPGTRPNHITSLGNGLWPTAQKASLGPPESFPGTLAVPLTATHKTHTNRHTNIF